MRNHRGFIAIGTLIVVFVIGGLSAVCGYMMSPQLPPPTVVEQVIHK